MRMYQAKIRSIGLKFEFAIRLNFIFFIDTNLNYFDSNKIIELGGGIDLTASLSQSLINFDLCYAPLSNVPGSLLILSIPIGLAGGISYISSGSLTPIAESS